jgi:hypothetical protein
MEKLEEVFVGFDHTVRMVQLRLLDEAGIQSLIKNDFASGLIAGFVDGTASTVRLFVNSKEADRALSLIEKWEIS